MAGFNVLLVGHTTADLSDPARVGELAEGLKRLSGREDLVVRWDDPPDFVESHEARYSSLPEAELAEIYAAGGVALATPDNRLEGLIDWHRLRGPEIRPFLDKRGHVQNQVSVHARGSALDDEVFRAGYVELAKRIAVSFDVSLLYACDPTRADVRYAGRSGLGVGLRDLYWLTVLGPPFVRIIGRERLLECPAYEVEAIAPEAVSLRVTDAITAATDPSARDAYRAVRECIGERFFARTEREAEARLPKSGSLLNPFRLLELGRFLGAARRQFDDEAIKADVCPEFDWSDILLGDDSERP